MAIAASVSAPKSPFNSLIKICNINGIPHKIIAKIRGIVSSSLEKNGIKKWNIIDRIIILRKKISHFNAI
jgi:hypothetical protein